MLCNTHFNINYVILFIYFYFIYFIYNHIPPQSEEKNMLHKNHSGAFLIYHAKIYLVIRNFLMIAI